MSENKMNFLVNQPVNYIGKPFDSITIPVKTSELSADDKTTLQYKLLQVLKEYDIELNDIIKFE